MPTSRGMFGASGKAAAAQPATDLDVQKKFGNAKAISSDMMFGNNEMDVSAHITKVEKDTYDECISYSKAKTFITLQSVKNSVH